MNIKLYPIKKKGCIDERNVALKVGESDVWWLFLMSSVLKKGVSTTL